MCAILTTEIADIVGSVYIVLPMVQLLLLTSCDMNQYESPSWDYTYITYKHNHPVHDSFINALSAVRVV